MGVRGGSFSAVDSGRILNHKIRYGTDDFSEGPAMTREEAIRSLESGIRIAEQLAPETDVFGTGEMGHRQYLAEFCNHRGAFRDECDAAGPGAEPDWIPPASHIKRR